MRLLLTILAVLIFIPDVEAGGRRRERKQWREQTFVQPVATVTYAKAYTGTDKECTDALAEVNACRSQRGLPAFLHDKLLTQAAVNCAKARAASQIHGHLSSDFDYMPSGCHAVAAGCGALDSSWGWASCCTFDNYTYAGAAWVMGTDNRRYMHIFVR